MTDHLHLAVALDGAGWHPAAWRESQARPADLFDAAYWIDLARTAERGLLDFVTVEDALTVQSDDPFSPDERTDRVRGRLDAVEIAARVAPTTTSIGFVPTAVVTHTEPFHLSKAVATLDYVSSGRAGLRVQVAATPQANANVGRRQIPDLRITDVGTDEFTAAESALFGEAADYVEVVRRLWDSWEDDAEIRDVTTGRFIDRHKLHYIDFAGADFSVKGPSITPRPPQGQPPVTVLAHLPRGLELIGESADIGLITPHTQEEAADSVATIHAAAAAAGRNGETIHVFADLVVFLDDTDHDAHERVARLDDAAGAAFRSDAPVFVGTAAGLADLLVERQSAGLSGFRLRPGTLPTDLDRIVDGLVPELQRRGAFRSEYPKSSTLRGLLGLPRPTNRYATAQS
ncbi:Flavin-dependent oxidoreductase, luciferase family (includes alkanesulfonate monooxygenase SsuD and methylene tetrahydromethanopterin reductase) [Gordonia malaquae]|uniref:Putative FMNH2-dependent monooxygenase n=1 Tax=Gordonia malaquae NBRC 108250 TaxID=1223542 RepID=M3VEQ7_GORML|nr:LLM class flavin-dependent oxidoreductase [Gordonia malaquae]GAC79474.1 putative FMNH2-dependent monooxygenase [Gordonia malaquae NBRC 108250]SED24558.1 Flavin-dependent oxidoreductase, luciferase family (includes alkanesulfonate monooxygenase SsuD and methylene tetrahydromethanopterin reductase) [Gordonia malaquae]